MHRVLASQTHGMFCLLEVLGRFACPKLNDSTPFWGVKPDTVDIFWPWWTVILTYVLQFWHARIRSYSNCRTGFCHHIDACRPIQVDSSFTCSNYLTDLSVGVQGKGTSTITHNLFKNDACWMKLRRGRKLIVYIGQTFARSRKAFFSQYWCSQPLGLYASCYWQSRISGSYWSVLHMSRNLAVYQRRCGRQLTSETRAT